ncbi:PepSY domain-containing protein [Aliiroseovarius subalbicans]|uniref:PepSY-associated TM helix domain-containing protein n=1 Tax=Aliiroseovarius subalbicans TaxID=2925840 RepID=UPI001F55E0E7|nr:PepSY domain-containing protein [Aliiroseovarius subalbicans]MCI2400527.1 PepSY domain-containing protein [Aliiroseovarius subalbicans]
MTDQTTAAPAATRAMTGGGFYRLVWKWHFLAALFVLPFMFILSISGGLYLYKPQIEEALYADRLNVEITGEALPYATQIDAVRNTAGLTRLRMVTDPQNPTRATLIEFEDSEKVRSYAWVNPYTAEVLAITPRDQTFMRIVRNFHGELLGGAFGTKFVELAAHWAIVMMITGVYLWWPRGKRSLSDAVSLPKSTGRAWWRETHMFTGMLAAVLITPLLLTGLPWTDVWGGGLNYVQKQTGQKSHSLRFGGRMPKSTTAEGTALEIETLVALAQAEGLVGPYEIKPPRKADGAFWMRSGSTNRAEQTELVVDQYSGDVLKRIDFENNSIVAKLVSWGISLHQGELFGPLNLALNTLAAGLGVLLSVSGFVAWWKRRPAGQLGVPVAPEAALSWGMIALVVVMALLLPLMGATLILALLLDWLLFKRLGWFRSGSTLQPAE